MVRKSDTLGHILLGSAIGALLGLVLLALGLALILNALEDQAVAGSVAAPALTEERESTARSEVSQPAASQAVYPALEAGPDAVMLPRATEPLPPESRSTWRSVFEDDRVAVPPGPAEAPMVQAPAAPRATRQPAVPRTAPRATTQEDSLFY